MIVNTTRILHVANFGLWLIQFVVWWAVAHNIFMGVASFAGALLSLWLADRAHN